MSEQFNLTRTDTNKWVTNTIIFAAPVLLLYLGFVQTQISDGFSWNDFVPNDFVIGSIVTYLISVITDILRKYISTGK